MNRIIENLHKNYPGMIKFLQSLIRINSVNNHETKVAKVIQNKLREYGIKSKLIGKNKMRKSLIALVKGKKGGKSIMLNGHLDTVAVGDLKKWRCDPFSAKFVNGKIYGRGSHDTKGGVAAMIYSVISILGSGTKLNGDIILVFNSDEEGGDHAGIREVLNSGVKADACINGEPTRKNRLRIGSRGIYRFKLITKGKTGHTGSIKKEGINAVMKMAKILLALDNMKPKYKKHKLCPPPRINPGTIIKGGSAINIVPDRCEALIDYRLSLGQTKKTLLNEIRRTINSLVKKDKEISYETREIAYCPAYITNKKEEIVAVSVKNIKKNLGIKPTFIVSGPITDGNFIFKRGIPVVTLGPKGDNSHSENEFVYAKSMLDVAKVYSSIVLDFLN